MLKIIFFLLIGLLATGMAFSQPTPSIPNLDQGLYPTSLSAPSELLPKASAKKLRKSLQKMNRLQTALMKKLREDSAGSEIAKRLCQLDRTSLVQKLRKSPAGEYVPQLDSLQTGIKFLTTKLSDLKGFDGKLDQLGNLSSGLSDIQAQIGGYQQQLEQMLPLASIKKYSGLIREYQQGLGDLKNNFRELSAKLFEKLKLNERIAALLEGSDFAAFFPTHNLLSGIFGGGGSGGGGNTSAVSVPGSFQTRQALIAATQARFGNTAQGVIQRQTQSVSGAAGMPNQDLLNRLGGIKLDSGWLKGQRKPASTAVSAGKWSKDFSFQMSKGSNYFPSVCQTGFDLRYGLGEKFKIGMGTGLSTGLGTGWKDIHITLRQIDIRGSGMYKIGRNSYASAEYEYHIDVRQQSSLLRPFKTSGYLGFVKTYTLSSKTMGSVRILWDFLTAIRSGSSQPLTIRFGYALP